ncbi:mannitol dehydrogenase family protein [Granulosicoccus sp.]|nr:mannitol dehydrogenase family protein [Granulosicoccus sp.]
MRLTAYYVPEEPIEGLGYQPEKCGTGIVHIGVGAFHRAHQAFYTDAVLRKYQGDWRITGVSLRSVAMADAINQQDGIYSLAIRTGASGELSIKLIGSIARVIAAKRDTAELFELLASARTRIVSMTVTEKAYGIDRKKRQVDVQHEDIAHDLKHPDNPLGIIGVIVKGLKLRMAADLPAFTVMCCDNLPNNGDLVRDGVLDFARRLHPDLFDWIKRNGAFPNSMVDRITPAATGEFLTEIRHTLGVEDQAAIETEPYTQWVVEDNFSNGRPEWQDVGVLFVKDVAPYERMKLRMLNGAHSLIAYAGVLSGHTYVRDAMADPLIVVLVKRHIEAAAQTLKPLDGIDFKHYAQELIARFENRNIAHKTEQIAMDGTQKLPQRIFEPALESLHLGKPIDTFAITMALWIAFGVDRCGTGSSHELLDPRKEELMSMYSRANLEATDLCNKIFSLAQFVPKELSEYSEWQTKVVYFLARIFDSGVKDLMLSIEIADV